MTRLLALMLCISLATGCSDDSDENRMDDLAGTVYSAYTSHDTMLDVDMYDTFVFFENGKVEKTTRMGGPRGKMINLVQEGTYDLNYPSIRIAIGSATLNGKFIDKNAFRINFNEYIRQ